MKKERKNENGMKQEGIEIVAEKSYIKKGGVKWGVSKAVQAVKEA